jgi:hypothetical protein
MTYLFCGGSGIMKNLLKLIEAATGLILVLSIFLSVVGAFYR